jgi:predicted site-specific integrase-resolvase
MSAAALPLAKSEDRLLSRKQIAEIYGVTAQTVYIWDRKGILKGVRVGRRGIRYKMSEVRAALEGQR